ncbi:MAG: 1-acyl-sn-glycerol-3-phosphate acyltransferase [Paramuribaculum sp.]|nr:1-acyl-sn-glycerol-3-phosphate acyltransferase [Paramuribaculum sp.]
MNLSECILRIAGWKVKLAQPDYPKCLICVAPHTSNWDFILCELAITSVGRRAGFLMKESWFFFPLGYLFRAIGGIPVSRKRNGVKRSLTELVVEKFNTSQRLTIAITPEGTRSLTSQWHTGFLHIANKTGVPLLLAAIDAGTKTIYLTERFTPTGNIDADMKAIKRYYKQFTGIYPDKFSAD